jgi:hypothetical protein
LIAHSHGRGLSPLQKGVPYEFLENDLFDLAGMVSLPPDLPGSRIPSFRFGLM